jgi:hypothetical protein
MVRDLWAECRLIAHGTVGAVVLIGGASGLATTAYVFMAPTAGVVLVCALVATLAVRIQHRQSVSGERRGR